MGVRSGLIAALLWMLLPGCYDDIVVDPGDHPCAACKSCERCVSDGMTASCVPRKLSAEMRCESSTLLAVLDSCDVITQVMDCGAIRECVEPKHGDAVCQLKGEWQEGDVCPGNWDASNDCSFCRNQWQGDDCEVCPGNWDQGSDCSACRNKWQGDDCKVCPGNWDKTSDCAVCRYHWQGNDCEICPAQFAAAADCIGCEAGWGGDDCTVCAGHRDLGSGCTTCLPGWADHDNDCGSCAHGLELDRQTDTCREVCGNRIVTASEACDDGNDTVLDGCDACAITTFAVSTHNGQAQKPSVAAAEDGAFVVVWTSMGQDGDGWGVYGRLFDASGKPDGGEFLVPTNTAGDQVDPKVGMARDESFVVVWHSSTATGGLLARRFAADGTPDGDEIVVLDSTGESMSHPAIAVQGDGTFTITGTTGPSINTQQYLADDSVGPAFRSGGAADPGASTDADGASIVMYGTRPVVAYVRERRYLAGVDTYEYSDKVMLTSDYGSSEFFAENGGRTGHDQLSPALATYGSFPIALAWLENNDGVYSLHGCYFNGLTAVGMGFQLRDSTGTPDGPPAVAVLGENKSVFAWREGNNMLLGVAMGSDGFLQTPIAIAGSQPSLASIPDGFVLAWNASNAILAQRYDADLKPLGRTEK